jgi:hypothetical protein
VRGLILIGKSDLSDERGSTDGEMIGSDSTRIHGNSVKDACQAIGKENGRKPHDSFKIFENPYRIRTVGPFWEFLDLQPSNAISQKRK